VCVKLGDSVPIPLVSNPNSVLRHSGASRTVPEVSFLPVSDAFQPHGRIDRSAMPSTHLGAKKLLRILSQKCPSWECPAKHLPLHTPGPPPGSYSSTLVLSTPS
jgi:hypothetical protein